jgi:hypothetical protein
VLTTDTVHFGVPKKQTPSMLVSPTHLLTCIHNIHHNSHHVKLQQFINSYYYIQIFNLAIVLQSTRLIMPPGLGKIQAHLARQGRRDFALPNQQWRMRRKPCHVLCPIYSSGLCECVCMCVINAFCLTKIFHLEYLYKVHVTEKRSPKVLQK